MTNFRSGYLEQGSAMPRAMKAVLLTADNQVVDPTGVTYLQISSDSTTATQRTFTLQQPGLVGQDLVLEFMTGSSTTCELLDTGAMRLAGNWTPTQYDTLWLMSDGTNWLENSRGPSAAIALASAHILVGNSSGLAADVAMSGDITITNAGVTAIGAGKVLLAMLGTGITPSHVVKFAGNFTTTAGSATVAQTLSGVASTDIVTATIKTQGGTPRTLLTVAPTTNTLTYVFSGDPSTDHVVAYSVLRAAT